MFISFAAIRPYVSVTAGLWSRGSRGLLGAIVFGMVAPILALGALVTDPEPASAQPEPSWVGTRVVQKQRDFALHADKEKTTARPREAAIHIYRVTKIDGAWLWLEAENEGWSGWAPADEVIAAQAAVAYFTSQMRDQPQDSFPAVMRSTLWHDQKDFTHALEDASEAIRREPHNPALFCNRGYLLGEQQKFDQAIADFSEAIRLDPHDAIAYLHRGHAFSEQRQFDKAVADFTETIRLDPKNAYAFRSRGHAWLDKKDRAAALADFSEAIWLDPKDFAAYVSRGLLWQAKGEADKALSDFDQAIALRPQAPVGYLERGVVWEHKGDYQKALADYDHAVRLDPKSASAHNARAWLLATAADARLRDGTRAVEAAKKACELSDWKRPAFLDTLAAACAEAGDFEGGVKWQSKAIELSTDAAEKKELEARLELYRAKTPYRQKGASR